MVIIDQADMLAISSTTKCICLKKLQNVQLCNDRIDIVLRAATVSPMA